MAQLALILRQVNGPLSKPIVCLWRECNRHSRQDCRTHLASHLTSGLHTSFNLCLAFRLAGSEAFTNIGIHHLPPRPHESNSASPLPPCGPEFVAKFLAAESWSECYPRCGRRFRLPCSDWRPHR